MPLEDNIANHDDLWMSYLKFGNGPNVLLAFHGFGRNAFDFQIFNSWLGKDFTIYSFNLFFHSGSASPTERLLKNPLRKKELADLINSHLQKKNITNFGLLGFSLGGRICLALAEFFPRQLTGMWLYAPDGLKVNWWYRLGTKTSIGNRIYREVLHNPQSFIHLLDTAHRIKLIDDKLKQFITTHIDSSERRELVYNVWMFFRKTEPNFIALKEIFHKRKIPFYLFLGKYDTVIPPQQAFDLQKRIPETKVFVFSAGHRLLTSAIISQTAKYFSFHQ